MTCSPQAESVPKYGQKRNTLGGGGAAGGSMRRSGNSCQECGTGLFWCLSLLEILRGQGLERGGGRKR